MAFNLRCRCTQYRTRWTEQEPASPHRYHVKCDNCGRFVAWGTHSQLMEHGAIFDIKLITWSEQEAIPQPTLDRFFGDGA